MAPVPWWSSLNPQLEVTSPFSPLVVCYLPTSLQFPLYTTFITAVFIQVSGYKAQLEAWKGEGTLCIASPGVHRGIAPFVTHNDWMHGVVLAIS